MRNIRYFDSKRKLPEQAAEQGTRTVIIGEATNKVDVDTLSRISGLLTNAGLVIEQGQPNPPLAEFIGKLRTIGARTVELDNGNLEISLINPNLKIIGKVSDFYRGYFFFKKRANPPKK